jgi:oligoendopeptidase F
VIDLTRYFPTPEAEAQSRAVVVRGAEAFAASATPTAAEAMRRWLEQYDALLEDLERHDIYVYLRAEENDDDTADAKTDGDLAALEDLLVDRLGRAAQELGSTRIDVLVDDPALAPYRYLLTAALEHAQHQLRSSDVRAADFNDASVLDAAASRYKALRRLPGPIGAHKDAYAALLVSIASARNAAAHRRGFSGADEASYFDKALTKRSVERTLTAVRASTSYARYRGVAARAPKPGFMPSPLALADAISAILAAEQPMGAEYANAYAALLNRGNHRLDICTTAHCDATGFSVGFAGVESGLYYGGYNASVNAVRAMAHEAGHAVHREFMSQDQSIAAYNKGPHFMFESFAIFNELLFLDHLYQTAPKDEQRAFYLDAFLHDATFQVFGSAEETDLESAIYEGVAGGSLKAAADFDALASQVRSRYDSSAAQNAASTLSWAQNRLFFTDPLYDVNYLYAGLLAEKYFVEFQRDPVTFSQRYVALLKNGFNDSPAALEKEFLAIDLNDEAGLVASASAFIDANTTALSTLYGSAKSPR